MSTRVLGKRSRNADDSTIDCIEVKERLKAFDLSVYPPRRRVVNENDDPLQMPITTSFKSTKTPTTPKSKRVMASISTPTTDRSMSTATTPTAQRIALDAIAPRTPSKRAVTSSSTPTTPSIFSEAKAIFRRSVARSNVIGRQQERRVIEKFWTSHVQSSKPGCLYISGCPGTGKTALINQIMAENQADHLCITPINCMVVKDPRKIYSHILQRMQPDGELSKDATKELEFMLLQGDDCTMHVIVLDEIDHLLTRDQEVLYKLFEWAAIPSSRLILIGIANALDLTDRFMPRLRARNVEPQLLHFNPYNVDEIITILKSRAKEAEGIMGDASITIQPAAIELCARKVAAASGDLRTALDIIRQAIEIVEGDIKTKQRGILTESPSRRNILAAGAKDEQISGKVSITHIIRITKAIFGTGSPQMQQMREMNLQQKSMLLALARMQLRGNASSMTFNHFFDAYCKLCADGGAISPVTKSEFQDVVGLLEANGLVAITELKGRGGNLLEKGGSRKVSLSASIEDVLTVMRGTMVLKGILCKYGL